MKTEKEFREYLNTIEKLAAEEGYDTLDEIYREHLRARFFDEDVIIGETDRVILRETKLSDLETFRTFEDCEIEVFSSKELLSSYIQNMYPLFDYGIWTVQLTRTKEVVGLCGLGRAEIDGKMCTDLGYYICPKWRKQGLASECVEIVLDYAKNYLEFPLIYAIIKKDNRISAKLLDKFGFEFLKMREDELIFQKKFAE